MAPQCPEIADVIAHIGRPLRIATMCSGTESPVLALDMISRAAEDAYDSKLQIEHLFSCEIEPFKQAYIERNFQPPLLFRDIRELGNEKAVTAYGAAMKVPGGADMLIAGTSCVDYSGLNTNQHCDVKGGGESGQTFRGMMDWIKLNKPPIVILENVSGAPWEKKVEIFEKELGYYATWSRVDTKNFYIPQTRMRGYLFAVRKDRVDANYPLSMTKTKITKHKTDKNKNVAVEAHGFKQQWLDQVRRPSPLFTHAALLTHVRTQIQSNKAKLSRPASAALDGFMFPSDDPRVLRGRARLSTGRGGDKDAKGSVDWTKCESRHLLSRSSEALGDKRPFSGWSDNNNVSLPSFAWNDWANAQVHRIHDLMDINTLRLAQRGIDGTAKTMIWNLSQNVDRDTMGKLGLSQCLTPTGVPYVTNRGGPLVGEELLLLQGIPADDLVLTRETEDNLKDLAGNAMSTTVVGACMLAALIASKDALLPQGEPNSTAAAAVVNLVPRALNKDDEEVTISQPPSKYASKRLNLSPADSVDIPALLSLAAKTCRRCVSEGKDGISLDLFQCTHCSQTASRECAIPPRRYEEHNFQPYAGQREDPKTFHEAFSAALPRRISIQDLTLSSSDKPATLTRALDYSEWLSTFFSRTQKEFNFTKITRGEVWTATYAAPGASLELNFETSTRPQWVLKIDAPAKQGAMRTALLRPVARMVINEGATSLLDGVWEAALPAEETFDVKFKGCGALVETFEAKLGMVDMVDDIDIAAKRPIMDGLFKDSKRHSKLSVTIPKSALSHLSEDISGTYELLSSCGTASGALHKRVNTPSAPMFMFMDPERCTLAVSDSFIFATTKRRLMYGEARETVAVLEQAWRTQYVHKAPKGLHKYKDPWAKRDATVVKCTVPGVWKAIAKAKAVAVDDASNTTVAVPVAALGTEIVEGAWQNAPAIMSCKVPLARDDKMWKQCERARDGAGWAEINQRKGKDIFKQLAWFTSRVALPSTVTAWNQMTTAPDEPFGFACGKCAPAQPAVAWKVVEKTKNENGSTARDKQQKTTYTYQPQEDMQEAAAYEQALKIRPAAFKAVIKKEGDVGHMQIACNGFSLTQRARAILPAESGNVVALAAASNARQPWEFSWRVVEHEEFARIPDFAKLSLTSNKKDGSAAQPPNFRKFPLRPEQLRSLSWMLAQEGSTVPHFEEEVSEAILGPMGWRAEGKVRRPTLVRGGIVADQVGYGKTAITLGLIDAAERVNGKAPAFPKELQKSSIFTKATLVVVPPHLMGQWPKEIEKFCGKTKRVLIIKDMTSFNNTTVEQIENADIVVVNFVVLSNDSYHERLARLGGANAGSLPSSKMGGRHFDAVYNTSVTGLEARCVALRKDRSQALQDIERDALSHYNEEQKAKKMGQCMRLDGKKSVYKNVREDLTKNLQQKPATPVKKSPMKSPKKSPLFEAKKSASVDTTTPESESEDEEASSSKVNRKTATHVWSKDARNTQMTKNQRDPWGLASNACMKQFSKMTCPPLELFCWNRVVIDEFHYLEEKKDRARVLTLVLGLKSNYRWCLSGTPPHKDFRDVLSLARLLGVHLGVDDVPPQANGQSQGRGGGRDADSTSSEKFSNMLDLKSVQWHQRRHVVAQDFLDRFVRQNIAEIDEIPQEEHLRMVKLPPAERAIYLELETHLKSLEMNSKKAKKSKKHSKGDRESRMQAALEDSANAEEALLKRCAHFDINGTSKTAIETCTGIVKMREVQMLECRKDLVKNIAQAARQRIRITKMKEITSSPPGEGWKKPYPKTKDWVGCTRNDNKEVEDRLQVFLDDVDMNKGVMNGADGEVYASLLEIKNEALELARKNPNELASRYAAANTDVDINYDSDEDDEKKKKIVYGTDNKDKNKKDNRPQQFVVFYMKMALREHVHHIRSLTKELTGRVRSLRYFRAVLDFNKKGCRVKCSGGKKGCKGEVGPEDGGLLSCCGHTGCLECLKYVSCREECVHADCQASVKVESVVTGEELGCKQDHAAGGMWGAKLTTIVESIKEWVKDGDRIIVFVQFKDLKEKISEALDAKKILNLKVQGTVSAQVKALDVMQMDDEEADAHLKGMKWQDYEKTYGRMTEKAKKDGKTVPDYKKEDGLPKVLLLTMDDESSSGINLTSCNHAVFVHPLLAGSQQLYDAYETQAIGRLRRYGQKKTVMIHRYLCSDTIDTDIWEHRGKEAYEEREREIEGAAMKDE